MRAGLVLVVACAAIAVLTPAASSGGGWCGGTQEAASDRLPDAVAARQIHVVYAIPSDGQDEFSENASSIVSDLAAVDAWWRREDPARTPRFDLSAFPGCSERMPALDLSSVRLVHEAAYYRPIDGRSDKLRAELGAVFADPAKKYLVYYDGQVDAPFDCGQSAIATDAGGAAAYSFVYLQAGGCTHDLGAGAGTAGYAAHELVHNLGAVPDAAPHICFEHSVCDWYWDVEMQFPTGDPISKLILDDGRDDYYGHSGGWFDLQDSPWLSHLGAPRFELAVTLAGRGRGSVASVLPGIACGAVCSIAWEQGTRVVLQAAAEAGSRFLHWGGACAGGGECAPTMEGPRSVSATFAPAIVRLAVSVNGRGSVRSAPPGIACPRRCSASFPSGTTVRLTARADRGWRLAWWSGACRGRTGCSVYEDDDRRVAASFRKR